MRTPVGVAVAAVVMAAAAYAFSPRAVRPTTDTARPIDRMHVNSIAATRAGHVAGGEFGQLMLTADQGRHWRAAALSAQRQALITQVAFAAGPGANASGNPTGIAVGHEGWILRSEDGGQRWREQAFDQENGEPLMGVASLAPGRWVAVGAFGRALASHDDGRTWRRLSIAGVEDRHLNRIAGSADGRHWLIVGERGLVLRSADGGASWETTPPFYKGSFYGAARLGQSTWVVYGMRGNVFRSDDDGRSWAQASVPAPVSTFAHALAPDGRLLLAGQGGTVLESSDDGRSFRVALSGGRATLTDIALLPGGRWMLASDMGMRSHPPAAADAAPAAAALVAQSTPGRTK